VKLRLLSNQRRNQQVSSRSELTPWLSRWLKLRESRFEFVKFELSSELKTKASNIRTSFNILPIVQTTIGRYQRTNRPIPIIGKTADNRRCISITYVTSYFFAFYISLKAHSKCTAQKFVEDDDKCCYRNATRYLRPSFSNSAITQSVIYGVPEQHTLTQYGNTYTTTYIN